MSSTSFAGQEESAARELELAEQKWADWSRSNQPGLSQGCQAMTDSENKAKDDKIKKLEQQIVMIQFKHNEDWRDTQQEAEEECQLRFHIADAIMERQMYLGKPDVRNDQAIQEGNKVAHYGSALAHASRICNKPTLWKERWLEEFGMPPLLRQRCTQVCFG
jgi:hypothetical protein